MRFFASCTGELVLNLTAPNHSRNAAGSLGFLSRLRQDESGNVLGMMAMAIFPLAGLVGGGVDMSRMYLAKSRLQQACDAGALAGRKVMGGSDWTANESAAPKAAIEFFDGNYKAGAYGTTGLTKAYAENAGRVTGTASVTVPMTVMKILGARPQTLEVQCEAELRLPNTDIMFVIDTTGSMNETLSGDSVTKIVSLKKAVKCFYETVARLDTDAVCETSGSGPSGGTGTQTQIRFGFVPYATNVNVGKLLPTAYFANEWTYQSRKAETKPEDVIVDTPNTPAPTSAVSRNDVVRGAAVVTNTYSGITSNANCQAKATVQGYTNEESTGPEGAPYNQQVSGSPATRTHQTSQPYKGRENGALWDSGSRMCYVGYYPNTYKLIRTYSATDSRVTTTRQVFKEWRYAQLPINISALKNAESWNNSFTLPIDDTIVGAASIGSKTIQWDGCIEERATIRKDDYSSLSAQEKLDAKDLDFDLIPNQSDAASLWKPALPDLIYGRAMTVHATDPKLRGSFNRADLLSEANNVLTRPGYFCPTEARKLKTYAAGAGVTDFQNYVNSITPSGNTYHDIGLIWGARFISPTGLFAAANAKTASGGEIDRHIIFMTDGETCTGKDNYGPYGFPALDRRQTDEASEPTDGCSKGTNDGGTLSVQVNKRFTALCTKAKNMPRTTLWVVYFGTTDSVTTGRMTNCATSGNYFPAANSDKLIESFKSIADKISQLRLVG